MSILIWLVSPERLVALVLLAAGVVGGLVANLPLVVVTLIALAFFAVGLMLAHYGLALWGRFHPSDTPVLVVHDPETHYATLLTGELIAAIKVPFSNAKSPKTGKGIPVSGFYAECRILDSTGHAPFGWTQARWDEAEQQHERPPGASLTSPEVRTIRLDPNGLKHFLETVIQVQNVPPVGEPRVLEPYTQAGRSSVGIQAPITVEVRWEGNEVKPGSRTMRVVASEPPGLDPHGEWID